MFSGIVDCRETWWGGTGGDTRLNDCVSVASYGIGKKREAMLTAVEEFSNK
jgi:hypothetical protein